MVEDGDGGIDSKVPCSEQVPDGSCPLGRVCSEGACIVDNLPSEPLPEDLDPNVVFDEVWNTVNDNYAAFWQKSVDWQLIRETYGDRAKAATTDGELYWTLTQALSEIRDAHTYAVHPSLQTSTRGFGATVSNVGACVTPMEDDKLVVYRVSADAPTGLSLGDEVVAFDGRSVALALRDLELQPKAYQAGSTEAQWLGRLYDSIMFRAQTDARLTVRHADGTLEDVAIEPDAEKLIKCDGKIGVADVTQLAFGIETKQIGENTTYVAFPFFGGFDETQTLVAQPFIEALRPVFDGAQEGAGMIIDLRSNGGGYPEVYQAIASWLYAVETPLFSYATKIGKGASDLTELQLISAVPDTSLQLKGKVAVLVNSRSMSAADFCPFFLQATGRARLFGEPSGGAFGAGAVFPVASDAALVLGINNLVAQDLDAVVLEGNPPDVDEPLTLRSEDAARGVDTLIEAALEYVEGP